MRLIPVPEGVSEGRRRKREGRTVHDCEDYCEGSGRDRVETGSREDEDREEFKD